MTIMIGLGKLDIYWIGLRRIQSSSRNVRLSVALR